MKPFVESAHCRSRAHCATCRADSDWRLRAAAPEVCPYGVTLDAIPIASLPQTLGPGTELKRMLAACGIHAGPSCQCAATMRKMDAHGPEWCAQHMEEIVAVMTEEASKRGWMKLVPFKALGARKLVERAIAASRQ